MELSAAEAPAGAPWWLAIALAVISAVSAFLVAVGPKWIERRKAEPAKAEVCTPVPARADSALTIVADAMDDLQRRLDERDRELAAANRRIAELEAQRGRRRNA